MFNFFKNRKEKKYRESFESVCKDAQLLCTEEGHIYECMDWHYETATYRSLATGELFSGDKLKSYEYASGNRINNEKCYFVSETKEMLSWTTDEGKMLEPVIWSGLLYIYHSNNAIYNEIRKLIFKHEWDEFVLECLEKYYPKVYKTINENEDLKYMDDNEIVEVPLTEEEKAEVQDFQNYYNINDGIMAIAYISVAKFVDDITHPNTEGEYIE